MATQTHFALAGLLLLGAACQAPGGHPDADAALPSWQDGPTRHAIVEFVAQVTTPGSPDFVPAAERVAVFDNDGTLWSEQPLYFQLAFALDRLRALAPQHPEWQQQEPFRSVLQGDLETALQGGEEALLQLVAASHAGTTTDEFAAAAAAWLETARHPRFNRPYRELVFQPMLELLDYLRAHDFSVWIVSGGGYEFLRTFAEEAYGVPPERVIGSRLQLTYEVRDGAPVLARQPELAFVDDKKGKPIAIHEQIGRRPIAAFGNSDGDFEMLEWTTAAGGARLGVLVHHDDPEREWAYDRESHIGRLARGLDEAVERGWTVVSMRDDWARIYPPR